MSMSEEELEVLRFSDLSIGARLLWLELRQWVTEDLPVCFPTQSKLCESLGVSRNSIIRWTKELVDEGLISVRSTQTGKRYVMENPTRRNSGVQLGCASIEH